MKKLALALLVSTVVMGASAAADTYKVDPKASSVAWVGKKVTGQHNGTIDVKSGEIKVEGGAVTGGMASIDMASIKNLDLTDKSYNDKLVGHLKSDDFFGVEKFPTSEFKVKSIVASKTKGATHDVTGDLTIKGTTNSLTFPATITVKDGVAHVVAKEVKVDRSKYNVKYGSLKFFPNLGDKVIYDEFLLDIDLVAKK